MKTPEQWMQESVWLHHEIAAIQSDAREGMMPAAELRPTIELLHLLRNRYSAVIHPTSVQDINMEISRLESILGDKERQ